MDVLHHELRELVTDLALKRQAADLLSAAPAEAVKTKAPAQAAELLRLVQSLRSGGTQRLTPLRKTRLLGNFITLVRQRHKECACGICFMVYEGNLPPQGHSSLLPRGMIEDLLRWVNAERSEKVRERLWTILLRPDVGLAAVAEIADVAAGLFEKDPVLRNTVIRFLFDHFPPKEVVDSLFQCSMVSGKRFPALGVIKYLGLLDEREYGQRHRDLLQKLLSMVSLDDKEMSRILSEYGNSLNRFDLVRLFSSSNGAPRFLSESAQEGGQRPCPLVIQESTDPPGGNFRQRISSLRLG